jgi:hypothetical protein
MTYDVGNHPSHGLRQAQKCGVVELSFEKKLLLKHLQGYKRRCFTLNSRGSR